MIPGTQIITYTILTGMIHFIVHGTAVAYICLSEWVLDSVLDMVILHTIHHGITVTDMVVMATVTEATHTTAITGQDITEATMTDTITEDILHMVLTDTAVVDGMIPGMDIPTDTVDRDQVIPTVLLR